MSGHPSPPSTTVWPIANGGVARKFAEGKASHNPYVRTRFLPQYSLVHNVCDIDGDRILLSTVDSLFGRMTHQWSLVWGVLQMGFRYQKLLLQV